MQDQEIFGSGYLPGMYLKDQEGVSIGYIQPFQRKWATNLLSGLNKTYRVIIRIICILGNI